MAIDTGVIADDLTGGVLVAALLEEQGIRCPVVLNTKALMSLSESPAVVFATRIRLAQRDVAVQDFTAAAQSLSLLNTGQIYYKYCATFDSTDDGNIGPCADALMDVVAADRIGFCPSFPKVGVTVYQGHIFLREELLSASAKRFDPRTPMPDPNLVQVLGRQTKRRVGLVPHRILTAGFDVAKSHMEALVRDGVSYLIFDAVDDADVAACAKLTRDWPAMTGGDTLSQMAPLLRLGGRSPPAMATATESPGAIIAGSCGPATLTQLRNFRKDYPVRQLALTKAAGDPTGAIADALNWAEPRLQNGGVVGLAISEDPDGVRRTQEELGELQAAQIGEVLCAEIAKGLFDLGVRRFLVAGGETSGAVAEGLGIEQLDVMPTSAWGGGLCQTRDPAPMTLLFKSGKMGSPTLFTDFMSTKGIFGHSA